MERLFNPAYRGRDLGPSAFEFFVVPVHDTLASAVVEKIDVRLDSVRGKTLTTVGGKTLSNPFRVVSMMSISWVPNRKVKCRRQATKIGGMFLDLLVDHSGQ